MSLKIIRKGSVKITHISVHDQSYLGLALICEIGHQSFNLNYAKLGGKEKIQIILSENEDGSGPTIISTGESWKMFNYDDGLSVLISKKMLQVNIVFYNKKGLKTKLI